MGTTTSEPTVYEQIEDLARRCAEEAVKHGAWAPWPEQGCMQSGDLDALKRLVGGAPTHEQYGDFDRGFRAAIDSYGYAAGQVHDPRA
jgi:hypothetical protein